MPSADRRAAIIAATRPLLATRGVTFTTREVAEAAGIAEGTIYRHFRTKEDLVRAVITDSVDPAPVCAILDELPLDIPLEERVTRAMGILREQYRRIIGIMAALHLHDGRDSHDGKPGPPAGHNHDTHRHHHDPHAEAWRTDLLRCLSRILAPDADRLSVPLDRAGSVIVTLAPIGLHPYDPAGQEWTPEELAGIALHGITTPATEPRESSC